MNDWPWCRLGALVADEPNALTDGPFGSKLKSEHYTSSGVRVIRLGNLGVGEFKDEDRSFVSEKHAADLERHTVVAGDLLIAALAEPVGRCCEVPISILPAIVKADCIRFRPPDTMNRRFVMHWLNSPDARDSAEERSHGVGRLRINMKGIREIPIPTPPRSTQDAVVEALEMHLSRLDAAVASLTQARSKVKLARASVLKAAVEGRLVPTEATVAGGAGRGYEPGSVLLAHILEERKRNSGAGEPRAGFKEAVAADAERLPKLPEGWVWASMDQLLRGIEAGKSFTAENKPPTPDQIGIVKVSAVTWGTYDETESKTVHDRELIRPAYFVRVGDFLFSRANTIDLVGAAVIVERVTRNVMLSDKILRLRIPVNLKFWVLSFLRSRHGRRQIEALATGNQDSMRNIGQTRIREIAVPLPPLNEMRRIGAEVARRVSILDAVDKNIDANLSRCSRLRQAILKRAFDGRLVESEAGNSVDGPHIATAAAR